MLELLLVSTGKAISSKMLVNPKELSDVLAGDKKPADLEPALAKRIPKAHQMLLGHETVPFEISAKGIADDWSQGDPGQEFKLGNSTISYKYPELIVKNSAGRESFKGNLGEIPDDGCTQTIAISDAHVLGRFHTMLFHMANYSMEACTTTVGRYYVLKLE